MVFDKKCKSWGCSIYMYHPRTHCLLLHEFVMPLPDVEDKMWYVEIEINCFVGEETKSQRYSRGSGHVAWEEKNAAWGQKNAAPRENGRTRGEFLCSALKPIERALVPWRRFTIVPLYIQRLDLIWYHQSLVPRGTTYWTGTKLYVQLC